MSGVRDADPDDMARMTKEERLKALNAIDLRVLDDGTELSAVRTIFNWRLCIGPEGENWFEDFYCYDDRDDVLLAVSTWDGQGDPPGRWKRHLRSARRRTWSANGVLQREWVER